MALYSCNKHGLTGPKMLCAHAARGMEIGVLIETMTLEVDDLLIPVVHLCEECLATWHRLAIGEEREKFLETNIPVCGKCFDEARGK
jgi:hypothetical protein